MQEVVPWGAAECWHTGDGEEASLNVTLFTELKLVKLLLRNEFLSVSQ